MCLRTGQLTAAFRDLWYTIVNYLSNMLGYRRFVPDEDLHIYSIDKVFLNVTAFRRLFSDKVTIARTIWHMIWQELRLVVTIGIQDIPLLAKLSLDNEGKEAADEIAHWTCEDVLEKVWAIHPITNMWGFQQYMQNHFIPRALNR